MEEYESKNSFQDSDSDDSQSDWDGEVAEQLQAE
jgi:hypothetical protein